MNARPQAPSHPFPFQLYAKAKAEGKTRVEKFGDYFHVLIERVDPVSKEVLPPITAVVERKQVEAARQKVVEHLAAMDTLLGDLKALA